MTPGDKEKLKLLVVSPEMDALRSMASDMITNWNRTRLTGTTEFDYLRESFTRDGKIEGLTAFIQELTKL